MSLEFIRHFFKKLLQNVSIHRNFDKYQFIIECVRKNLAKIPESFSQVLTIVFSMKCRRTYVLKILPVSNVMSVLVE